MALLLQCKKGAILVYGETSRESSINSQLRTYILGDDFIKEKNNYDHVGFKACIGGNYAERTDDKIGRALCAASGMGIKKGGVNMMTANIIFWSMIIPIITYASELWILKQQDIDKLEKFQCFTGRKIQRFRKSSPIETSFAGLGWMRLENYVYAKKMIFIRTVSVMKDESIYKMWLFYEQINFITMNFVNSIYSQ